MTYEVRGTAPLIIKASTAGGEHWYKRDDDGDWARTTDHKGPWLSVEFSTLPDDVILLALQQDRRRAVASMYPPDWPKCPGCGAPALDGHITCGNVTCDEGGRRS
jgi:hypothetical protein